MDRIKIIDALQQNYNSKILVKGWVRSYRANRFIALNVGSCLSNLQVVVDYENFPQEIIKNITKENVSIKII